MNKYRFCIGGINIEVDSNLCLEFGRLAEQFLTDEGGEPELFFHIVEKEVIPEGERKYCCSDYEVFETDGLQYRSFTGSGNRIVMKRYKADPAKTWVYGEEDILLKFQRAILTDYLGLEVPFLWEHAFLLHASFIKWQGQGILFSAPSGVGKSTQADLWKEHEGAEIVNGDRALIRNLEEGAYAYGSVFAGSSGIYRNESSKISAIMVLEQAEKNELTLLQGAKAFTRLYSQILSNPWNPEFVERLTQELMVLLRHVPVYLLRCRPDYHAVEIVKQEISMIE